MHKNLLWKKGSVLIIILLFIGMSVVPSTAIKVMIEKPSTASFDGNTLYVGGSGQGNYSIIQDAIDDASDGDTVFVFSGLYKEGNIEIEKSINLIGEDKNTTIIDGSENISVIYILSENVKVEKFTIKNFNKSGINTFSNNAIINENIFTNIDTGIVAQDDYHIITNNIFNSRLFGIFLQWSNESNVNNNIITDANVGIQLLFANRNTISGNIIKNNSAGILMYTDSNGNEILNNIISDNLVGIYTIGANDTIISGNTIKDNGEGHEISAGIFIGLGSNNHVTNNHISNNNPNGLYLSTADSYITDNLISNNEQVGVYLLGNNNYITDNQISNNGHTGLHIFSGANNIISENNFIDNPTNAYFYNPFFFISILFKTNKNTWDKNYWSDSSDGRIYIIHGTVHFLIIFNLPWFNIDWHPAKEPYDI